MYRTALKKAVDVGGMQFAASDVDQHANHAAHHLPQKVGARHADEHQTIVFADFNLFDHHSRRFVVRVVVAEQPEVVHAGKARRRCPHLADVERFLDPPHDGFANAVRRRET